MTIKRHASLWPVILAGISLVMASGSTHADSVSKSFTVQATLQRGCVLGGGSSDSTSFGNIDFGQVALLPSDVDVSSTVSGGTVVVRCTPGIGVTISLGTGLHATGSIVGGRFLKNTANADTLRYQLYTSSARSTVWGGGSAGGQAQSVTATGANQELVVYARLFAAPSMPTAGTYNDTVLVTVAY